MPGRLFLTRSVADVTGRAWPDAKPRSNIKPGEIVTALTAGGPQSMRWGMIPTGRVNARGRPVMEMIVNARSETVFDKTAYDGVGRAALPVDGWYEWTGEARRKTAWAITAKDRRLLWFAAITDEWNAPGGAVVKQLATLTCPPSADVRDIHHRMGVLLSAEDLDLWLDGTEAEVASLLRPAADGILTVAQARDVDWTAA